MHSHGNLNNRLKKTTSVVFHGPRVKRARTLARSLATRYIQSSQATDVHEKMKLVISGLEPLRVIQDVVTRWWSTYALVNHLFEMLETIYHLDPIMINEDLRVLEFILPVLQP